jgi:hypothetical protein
MKIIQLLVLLFVFWEVAEFLFRHSEKYRQSLGDLRKFQEKIPDNLEIVNIGSGPGVYAIGYQDCPWRGFNFSTAPQNYKYGFRILKNYEGKIAPNAIIIIIMCPLSFGKNLEYDRKDYSDQYYPFLPPKDIDHFSTFRAFMLRHVLTWKILRKGKRFLLKIGGKAQVSEEKVSDGAAPNKVVSCWKKEFDLYDLKDERQGEKHREAFQEKIKILREGIDYCEEKTWRPVLVIPPIPPQTREYISQEFLKCFVYDNLQQVLKGHQEVKLLDYYGDERFPKEMFENEIFANQTGKDLFSKILFQDIKTTMGEEEHGI